MEATRPSALTQLKAVLKKIVTVKIRNTTQSYEEFILPLVFVVIIFSFVNNIEQFAPTTASDPIPISASPVPSGSMLYYTPVNSITTQLVNRVSQRINQSIALVGIDHGANFDQLFVQHPNMWAGIDFDGISATMSNDVGYTIYMGASYVPSTRTMTVGGDQCRAIGASCPALQYFTSGFLLLQTSLDDALLAYKMNITDDVINANATTNSTAGTFISIAPKPAFVKMTEASFLYPLYLTFAFQPIFTLLVLFVVGEKEKKLKEGMFIMGLREKVYWGAWFIVYAVQLLVTVLIFLLLGSFRNLWIESNKFIVFLLLYLFALSIITMAFFFSLFFTKAKNAGSFTPIIFLLPSVVNIGIQQGAPNGIRWFLSLVSPIAFCQGISAMLVQEAGGQGTQWSNINSDAEGWTVANSLIMIVVDIALYSLMIVIAAKVDFRRIFTRRPAHVDFGQEKPHVVNVKAQKEEEGANAGKNVAIELNNLTKVFDNFVAVDNLSMKIYEGEIFGLLGHNGAGKSTTISILTGVIPSSSGSATINGYDVATQMMEIRQNIGYCPQHDIYYNELTVEEHLLFFGNLKGIPDAELKKSIDYLLKELDIESKRKDRASTLSGGMKRKLSLASALIGNPKVVFLDEPTAGLDPQSRRNVWELLQRYRGEGRVIILTTHYMDEADLLSDRICIMAKGAIECLGSSLFLKSTYGLNYNLIVEKNPNCDVNVLNAFIHKYVSGSTITRDTPEEITFALPLNELPVFGSLFDSLDANLDSLAVRSYGIAQTSLEEVFIKMEDHALNSEKPKEGTHSINIEFIPVAKKPEKEVKPPRTPTLLSQTATMLPMRYKEIRRRPINVFCQIVVPMVMIFVGTLLSYLSGDGTSTMPLLNLNPTGVYQNQWDIPYSHFTPIYPQPESFPVGMSVYEVDDVPSVLSQLTTPILGGFSVFDWNVPEFVYQLGIYFNDTTVHALPALVNALNSAKWREALGSGSLSASLQPLGAQAFSFDSNRFASVFIVGFSVLFAPTGFIVGIVRERKLGFKKQLRIMGLNNGSYWLSIFLSDWSLYLALAIFAIILSAAFDNAFAGPALGAFVVIILLSQLSLLGFSYVLSFLWDDPEASQGVSSVLFQVVGLVPSILVMILTVINESTLEIAYILHYVFSAIAPPYTLMGALNFIVLLPILNLSKSLEPLTSSDFFAHPTIYVPIICCLGQIVIFGLLLYYMEALRIRANVRAARNYKPLTTPDLSPDALDDDAISEMQIVDALDENEVKRGSTYDVVWKHLRKIFLKKAPVDPKQWWKPRKNEEFEAVSDITLAIPSGQCFGLLGPNGAGKTTTLEMVTAEITPTSGVAYTAGYDISKTPGDLYGKVVGYCPQFDALPEYLTGHELLVLYAKLKGYDFEDANDMAILLAQQLGITEHAHKFTHTYSGGTKRKLSICIALTGNPKVVYLDEPSAGIDPLTRRHLWDVIESKRGHQTTILTTHSMEEAEHLCSKMCIVVKGTVKCVGSAQHLKEKFGRGYYVEVKSPATTTNNNDDYEGLDKLIQGIFPDAVVAEQFGAHFRFHIPSRQNTSLGSAMNALQKLVENGKLEYYSLSIPSLEQIFISFAKKQDL